jgi:hypothetical protein
MNAFIVRIMGSFLLLTALSPTFSADDLPENLDAPAAAESWKQIRKHFETPTEFVGDSGSYRSPLIFNDGSVVRSRDDWNRRRAELLEQWTKLLGQWPPLITQPMVEILETIRTGEFSAA